ncbi:type II toxin-antitoxin system MqsR family toxin [Methylocystis echinoides]|nr:type II toxin-antitoxin system MqsR family toxin [Methylocystis echinoides]
MEKRRPTYDLDAIKQAIGSVDRLAITTSALRDASALGFDRGAIVETIHSVDRRMFVKSMTTFAAIGCGRTCRSWIAALCEISGGCADRVHGRLVQGKVSNGHERRAASRDDDFS